MATDLYSAGVQAFFVDGRRFDLCEVWVGEHESNTFKVWCECSNLLGMFDGDPHREVKTPDGWFKATWDEHFKAWMVKDWHNPIVTRLPNEKINPTPKKRANEMFALFSCVYL